MGPELLTIRLSLQPSSDMLLCALYRLRCAATRQATGLCRTPERHRGWAAVSKLHRRRYLTQRVPQLLQRPHRRAASSAWRALLFCAAFSPLQPAGPTAPPLGLLVPFPRSPSLQRFSGSGCPACTLIAGLTAVIPDCTGTGAPQAPWPDGFSCRDGSRTKGRHGLRAPAVHFPRRLELSASGQRLPQ